MNAVLFIGDDRQSGSEKAQHQLVVGGLSLAGRALRTLDRAGIKVAFVLAPERDLEALKQDADSDPHLDISLRWLPHQCAYDEATSALKEHLEQLPQEGWLASADRMLTPFLFEQRETSPWLSIHDGEEDVGVYAFSGGLQLPERVGPLSAMSPEGAPQHTPTKPIWSLVRTKEDLKEAQRRLSKMLRKPMARSADGLTAFYVNRPISIQMSRRLVNTPLTPNHITAIGLLMGLAAAFLVAMGSWLGLALGGLLLQLSSILDGVDGELARMRMTSSKSGEWFDTVCDDIINISFLSALGLASYKVSGSSFYLYLASASVLTTVITVSMLYRELIRMGIASHNHFEWGFEGEDKKGPVQAVLVGFAWVAKRDTYTLLLMALTIANLPRVAFMIMAIGALLVFAGTMIQKLADMVKSS